MKQYVIGDDRLDIHGRRQVGELVKPQLIIRSAAQCERQIGAIAKSFLQAAQMQLAGLIGLIGDENGNQAFTIGHEIAPIELAFSLAAPLLAKRQQPQRRE